MSARLIAQEIIEFLKSPEPQILCIFGKWGVGKTYAWNYYLRVAQATNTITFDRYAYVSLFGRTSLADARAAIVEATVDSRLQGILPSLESFDTLLSSAFRIVKFAKPFLPFLPKATGYGEGANRLLYLAISEQIVCFDDLERAGEKLKIGDILGLASELKERKKCKVVLLLNQEELADRDTFQQQLEKVADVALAFAPTPEEAVDIAIADNQPLAAPLKAACIDLQLVNIRVIRKAVRLSGKLDVLLQGYDQRILHDAVRTVVLGCFAKYQPDLAPPLEFVRSYNHMVSLFNKNKELANDDRKYDAVLAAYGHHSTDDLDSAIFDAVESGALDEPRIIAVATARQATLRNNDANENYRLAWRSYHDSFDDDETDLLISLERSVMDSVQTISPGGLSAAVKLMRELGHDDRANTLTEAYIAQREAPSNFWNLASHHFGEPVDNLVKEAFNAQFQKLRQLPSFEEAVGRIADERGYTDETLEVMAAASIDDYYRLFKGPLPSTASRPALIEAALQFGDFANASDQMLRIARSASEAVRRIGRESKLNALRIQHYRLTD